MQIPAQIMQLQTKRRKRMLENLEEIDLAALLNKIKEVKNDDFRVMQICATKIGDDYIRFAEEFIEQGNFSFSEGL